MGPCDDCALCRARLRLMQEECNQLRKLVAALQEEVEETNAAFWELAGDVRLSPVHVDLVDNYVSVIFPSDVDAERGVAG